MTAYENPFSRPLVSPRAGMIYGDKTRRIVGYIAEHPGATLTEILASMPDLTSGSTARILMFNTANGNLTRFKVMGTAVQREVYVYARRGVTLPPDFTPRPVEIRTNRGPDRRSLVLGHIALNPWITLSDLLGPNGAGVSEAHLTDVLRGLMEERLVRRVGYGRAGHPYRFGMFGSDPPADLVTAPKTHAPVQEPSVRPTDDALALGRETFADHIVELTCSEACELVQGLTPEALRWLHWEGYLEKKGSEKAYRRARREGTL